AIRKKNVGADRCRLRFRARKRSRHRSGTNPQPLTPDPCSWRLAPPTIRRVDDLVIERARILGAPAMLLAYDDFGPGPVVVLLHGFPLNRKIWSAQETSIGSMYRVIAPDLRGHGTSAAPEGIYTMDAMAGDVIALLDALQIKDPVVLGGLSM